LCLTPLSLLFRWTVIVLATTGLLRLGWAPAALPYAAAFVPSILIRLLGGKMARLANLPVNPIIRGTHIGTYAEAVAKAALLVRRATGILNRLRGLATVWITSFGGVDLPLKAMEPHYLILGTAGSGKTISLRLIMQSVLFRDRGQLLARAVVYDAKREFYSLLAGMGIPSTQIVIMNPADSRAAAWDIAADIRTKDDAHNIAVALAPLGHQEGREHVFFTQAIQSLLTAVMMTLHRRSPGNWELNEVLKAMANPDTLKRFFNGDREAMGTYKRYFTQAPEAVGGIISTMDTKIITPYETIARIWARCGQKLSLKAWATETQPSILILGADENRDAVDHINQAMFRRIVDLVSARPQDPQDPDHHDDAVWFFLDELRFAGQLPMLGQLISLGRSQGVRAVLAAQDIDGLYAEYGEHKTNELLALCGNISVFRLISPKTREWAAKLFGDYESWETDHGTSRTKTYGPGFLWFRGMLKSVSHGETTNRKIVKRESILPSEFFNVPKAGPEHGLPGLFATPAMGAWRGPVPWAYVQEKLMDKDPGAPGFVPRPPEDYDPVPANPPGPPPAPGLFDKTQPPASPTPPAAPATPGPKPKTPQKPHGRLPQ
ncbi:MAG: type IV secretion system DNA-binding domain-containing protein, partial [Tepidisphaeraceae bacterium]